MRTDNLRKLPLALLALFAALLGPVGWAGAAETETPARYAYLVDMQTGTVLLEKDAEVPMHPASMSKLMTLYVLFDKLKNGGLSLKDEFAVSEKAWRMGGSKMFVEVGTRVSVEDLVRGIVVQSGNDACIVVAEGISGSEAAFADLMNETARRLGLTDSHFVNSTGWPHPEHVMSSKDLALLAQAMIRDFPDYYAYFAETSFTYSDIRQGNRNPLLYKNVNADGLKTGHTEASGYGIVASATRGERRLVLVVNGLDSVNQRSRESERLLEWGFREFATLSLFAAGETVEAADVWLGQQQSVPLRTTVPVAITVPRSERDGVVVKVLYEGPVPAPIAEGTPLATLRVEAPGLEPVQLPLYAAADVPRLGFVGRITSALSYLLLGPGSS